jgi:hypothetical protein
MEQRLGVLEKIRNKTLLDRLFIEKRKYFSGSIF